MKKNNKKGFTLAELLVVVAIIAVLIAVAIPTFTAATDRAKYGVELANARSAYAEAKVDYITSKDGKTLPDSWGKTGVTYDGVKYTVAEGANGSFIVTLTGGSQLASVTFNADGSHDETAPSK